MTGDDLLYFFELLIDDIVNIESASIPWILARLAMIWLGLFILWPIVQMLLRPIFRPIISDWRRLKASISNIGRSWRQRREARRWERERKRREAEEAQARAAREAAESRAAARKKARQEEILAQIIRKLDVD